MRRRFWLPLRERRARCRWAAAFLSATAALRSVGAQQAAPPSATTDSSRVAEGESARWRVGPFVGAAHNSPVTYLGLTRHRDHFFLGVEAATPVLRLGPVHVAYTLQLLPVVLVDGRQAPDGYYRRDVPGPERAYAWGISPFGFELSTPTTKRLAVYGAAAAGGLVFSRPFPVPEAQRTNFTLEYGGGVEIRVADRRWMRLGYKYHHLSNAYTARYNPGLDGNVFYAGYEWSVRLPR